jgi:hypothetical protein
MVPMVSKLAIDCEMCAFDKTDGELGPCPDGCPTSVEESEQIAEARRKEGWEPKTYPPLPQFQTLSSGEVRVTSKTGGAKGVKPAQYALIPTWPLHALAVLFGKGNSKYPRPDGTLGGPNEQNWTKGYPWSLSISALMRHLEDWREGEKETPQNPPGEPQDPTAGTHPLISVAWHCFVLYTFEKFGLGTDDRMKAPKP